jgi:hypothetical protein
MSFAATKQSQTPSTSSLRSASTIFLHQPFRATKATAARHCEERGMRLPRQNLVAATKQQYAKINAVFARSEADAYAHHAFYRDEANSCYRPLIAVKQTWFFC